MAIDGIFLHLLARQISEACAGARVDKIHQPARETLLLAMRGTKGNQKLLLCASSQSARIQLTQKGIENPSAPPMFCMLLRKYLSGAKLAAIEQVGLDRILQLRFQARNEFGDAVELRLSAEIMGRHSNLILIGPQGNIIDAIKRVDPGMSSVRQVLPNLPYSLPPMQDKANLLEDGAQEAARRILSLPELPLEKAVMRAVMGVSPVVAQEAAGYVSRGGTGIVGDLTKDGQDRLSFFLERMAQSIASGGTPTMVLTREGVPKDVSFMPLAQYHGLMITKEFPSYSALLDAFFSERDVAERMKQRSGDLFRFLANLSERIERKLQNQREELLQSGGREGLRIKGELLNANLYRLKKGDTIARLENFYEPDAPIVEIPLNPRLSPAQNAQHYYTEYRKADNAERMLKTLIGKGEEEHRYIDTVLDSLMRATSEAELSAIRSELADGGYLRSRPTREKRVQKLEPVRYCSSDGFTILQGRGNVQNDQLTMKQAHKNDIWFHAQNIPGSHVILVTQGRTPPERTLEEAANIAAYHSKSKHSALVPVDYTEIRNVRKPAGAKPGFVLYVNYRTAIVTPDGEKVQSLIVE